MKGTTEQRGSRWWLESRKRKKKKKKKKQQFLSWRQSQQNTERKNEFIDRFTWSCLRECVCVCVCESVCVWVWETVSVFVAAAAARVKKRGKSERERICMCLCLVIGDLDRGILLQNRKSERTKPSSGWLTLLKRSIYLYVYVSILVHGRFKDASKVAVSFFFSFFRYFFRLEVRHKKNSKLWDFRGFSIRPFSLTLIVCMFQSHSIWVSAK